MAPTRIGAGLMGSFGMLALLLAAIGLYGVIAYAVSLRTREVGIRLALGASRGQVLRQVLSEGGRLAAAGLALGTIASIGVGQILSSLLYGVSRFDPVAYGAATALLLGVAIVANLAPAFAAARIDPLRALRRESSAVVSLPPMTHAIASAIVAGILVAQTARLPAGRSRGCPGHPGHDRSRELRRRRRGRRVPRPRAREPGKKRPAYRESGVDLEWRAAAAQSTTSAGRAPVNGSSTPSTCARRRLSSRDVRRVRQAGRDVPPRVRRRGQDRPGCDPRHRRLGASPAARTRPRPPRRRDASP